MALTPAFEGTGIDWAKITVGSGIIPDGHGGYTFKAPVTMRPDCFDGNVPTPREQLIELTRESSHTMQYRQVGTYSFLKRYYNESSSHGSSRYNAATGGDQMRVALKVGVNEMRGLYCVSMVILMGCFAMKDLSRAGIASPPGELRTFGFYMCPGESRSASIGLITIRRLGTGVVSCELVSRDPVVKLTVWHLDEVPAGFEAIGTCEPLRAGARYEVSVTGSASGRRKFTLGDHGKIVFETTDNCR